MNSYGKFFSSVAWIFRRFYKLKVYPPDADMPSPAVYLCQHRNNRGPLYLLPRVRFGVRPWVYHVFCERGDCFKQLYGYTLTKRLRWPKPCAWVVARLGNLALPALAKSMRAIPVYRGGAASLKTMRQSLDALLNGESILIFPDVEYTNRGDRMGEIYKGFLLLEPMFYKKTGGHLPFIPIRITEGESAEVGKPLFFADGSYKDQAEAMAARILNEANSI